MNNKECANTHQITLHLYTCHHLITKNTESALEVGTNILDTILVTDIGCQGTCWIVFKHPYGTWITEDLLLLGHGDIFRISDPKKKIIIFIGMVVQQLVCSVY